jgi:hypothetical protein
LLGVLDKFGFLTERGRPDPAVAISGSVFWSEVEAFANRAKSHFQPLFYPALVSGAVGRSALVRYALEYFQIVRAGPAIIAGALAHVGADDTRRVLERFLVQETGHDRLLLDALMAVGLDEPTVRAAVPLPETFAVIAALQTLADQDPLAFKATAFLLEEASPEFHAAFASAAERVGLHADFVDPIVRHAHMNSDGDHGRISADLLADVEVVSTEERIGVLKHLATIIESLVVLESAILHPANSLIPPIS